MSLLLAVSCLAGLPAQAQSNNYGRVFCSPSLPCADDPNFPAAATLAANANSCAMQSYGAPAGGQYFDALAGVDGNGCLTTLPGSMKDNNDSKLMVQCCLTKLQNSQCTFRCELNKQ